MALGARIQKKILETAAGKNIIRGSQQLYLPGFSGLSLYEVWNAFLGQLRRTSLVERASGVSFNMVMAMPPTLLFIFTLVPLLPISEQFLNELFALVRTVVPGAQNHAVIVGFLQDLLQQPRTGLLSFGLLATIYFSSNAMMGILRAFDRNYPGFSERRGWQRRKVALTLSLVTFVLFFMFLLLLIAQAGVLTWLGIQNKVLVALIHYARWGLIFLLLFCIVSFIYKHGPAVTKKWPLVTPGSVMATCMMIGATGLVSWWITNFGNYNKLYGSISALFIVMSLIYINALAVLMGFELNVTLSNLRQQHATAAAQGEMAVEKRD